MNADSRGENTPQGLRSTAQGCPASRATLGYDVMNPSTLKGLRSWSHGCGTPSGFWRFMGIFPRVALLRRTTLGCAAQRFQRTKIPTRTPEYNSTFDTRSSASRG